MKKGSLVKLLMIVAAICMAISAFTACTGETSVSAKFVVDGRIYATVELNGQTEIDLPGDPEKAGYVFDGWYLDNGTFSNVFEGTLPEMKTNVSILIYAKWKECEHELSDWVLAEAPTCEDDGKEVQTCSICGLQNVRAIAATGHVEVIDAAVEATCTKAGLTEGKHCATCEKVLVKQKVVKALGHTAVLDKGYAATCTEKGLTDGKHCSTCGEILTAQKDIPAKGHKEVIDNAVAATCTKTGLTEGKHCSVCEKVLTAQTVIPAKGHQYGDVKYVWNKTYTECTATRTCEINCKEEGNTQTVAATVKATISQPQTCETPEKTTYTATFAEDWATEQKIENVQTKPVLGHAYTKQTLNYKATDATCVKQATYYYSCKNCGKSSQGTAKEATFAYGDYAAHDYVKVGAMPYTCYTNGYKEHYKCSVCSDYLDADEKPATWTEIELKAKHLNLVHHEAVLPDGENPGHTAYDECTICGYTTKVEISAEHKSLQKVPGYAPTCTTDGRYDFYICNDPGCGYTTWNKNITIPALGHDYKLDTTKGVDGYVWSADHKTCTVYGICQREGCTDETTEHVKAINATVAWKVTKTATCLTAEETTFTPTFSVAWASSKAVVVETNPALGHDYGKTTYVWSNNNTVCTATHVCERVGCANENKGHTQTATATITPSITQNATCLNPELTTYTATFDEKLYPWAEEQKIENVKTKDALGHDYGDLVKAKPATCTDKGYNAYYYCEACKTYFDENKNATTWADLEIPAKGHSYGTLVTAKAETCTDKGYNAYYYCEACKTYFDENKKATTWDELEINAKGHAYGDLVKAKAETCTDKGYNAYYYCEACETYFDENKNATTWADLEIPAKGHSYGTLVTAKAETCTDKGYNAYYYCEACKTYFDENKKATTWGELEIPAKGHSYGTLVTAKAETCTDKGYNAYYYCEACKTYFDENKKATTWGELEINAKGHNLTETKANAATCTKPGNIAYWTCGTCGGLFTDANGNTALTDLDHDGIVDEDDAITDKKGHDLTETKANAATCTEDGNIAYWTCGTCGGLFTDANGNTALTNKNDDAIVDVNDTVIEALGHNYGTTTYKWNDDNTECVATRTCTRNCGEVGHTETAKVKVTPNTTQQQTCTLPELTTYTATFDKMLYPWAENQTKENVQTKDAKGHSLTATEANAATCTKPGNIAYWTCGTCGGLFTDANGNTALTDLDHDGIVDEDDAITDKKGHDLTETKANAATCTKPGNIAYWTCGTCGGLFTDANGNTALTNKNDDAIVDVNDTVTPAKGHDFTQQKAEDKYLKSAATCHEHAVYYKSCATCGESSKGIDEEATFSFGPTLPHNYENATVTYTWNETNTECTASRNCQNKGCTFEETQGVSTSSKTTAATCVSKAKTTYTAPLGGLGWAENQTKDVESGEPLGHDYDTTTYAWKEGYTECTATHTCKREGCTDKDEGHTETATTTSVTSKVTQEKSCLKDELTTYTATFSVAWACKYEDKVKTADHLGHDYGDTKYEWNETNTECTAIRTCKRNCDELGPDDRGTVSVPEENIKITQKQTCTLPELTTYTANFDGLGWATTQDVKDVKTKDALGHVDENKDHACDRENCNATVGEHKAAEGSHVCDYCKQTVSNHTGGTATCTEKATCTICGDKYGEYATHAYGDLVPEDPASCTETGTEAHYQCSVCKAYFDADKNATTLDDLTIKALGHKDEDVKDNVCDTCNCLLENITISDYATANNWTNSTKYTTIETNSGVTITANGGDNTGKYYTNGNNWRIYQNENPAITFTASNCTLVTVKITYTISNAGVLTLGDKQIASGTTVTVSGNTITFGVGNTGTADNGQVRITAIQIAYTVSDQQKVDKIANAFTALTYETISAAGYTLPATSDEATITWSSNNAAIVIAEDGTVTINNGEQSVDVTLTATFTLTGENGQEVTASKDYTIEVPTKGKYSVKNSENSSGNATVQFCGADGNYDQTELSIYAGEFTFKVTVSDPDYAIDTVKINGSAITPDDNDIYTYNVTNANIEVLVTTKRIKGTQENPYTAKEALAILENLGDETSEKVYVIGYIKEITSTTQNNFKFVDKLTDTNALTVFKATLADGVTIYQNDKVLVSGYLMMFGTTPELAYSGSNNAKVESVAERGTSTITYTGTDKVTISGDTSGTNGEEFTFTLTLAEGYKVTSVKVNGELVTAGEDGTYTATIKGNTTVEVETAEEGAAEPTSATYDFVDGKDISDWNSWKNSYVLHEVSISDGKIVLSRANKQQTGATIDNRPVVAAEKSKTEYVTLNLTKFISAVTFNVSKWGSDTDSLTVTIEYSTDGTTWALATSTGSANKGQISANFTTAVKYARLSIKNAASASGNKRLGITSVTVNFAAESGTEGGGTEGGETGGDTPATTYEVTVSAENATVTVWKGTEYVALTDNKFETTGEFKIKVVAADGYEIKSVKMGENALTAVEGEEGVYEGTATANATITVTAEVISSTGGEGETGGTTEPTLVATLNLGTDGKTLPGSTEVKTETTISDNERTLTVTAQSKAFSDCVDEKGNGCWRLGTSKAGGSVTFEISGTVSKIKIYIAKYTTDANKSYKIKINGTEYDLTKDSSSGEYDVIEIELPTNGTIKIETSTKNNRCVIDKVECYA